MKVINTEENPTMTFRKREGSGQRLDRDLIQIVMFLLKTETE